MVGFFFLIFGSSLPYHLLATTIAAFGAASSASFSISTAFITLSTSSWIFFYVVCMGDLWLSLVLFSFIVFVMSLFFRFVHLLGVRGDFVIAFVRFGFVILFSLGFCFGNGELIFSFFDQPLFVVVLKLLLGTSFFTHFSNLLTLLPSFCNLDSSLAFEFFLLSVPLVLLSDTLNFLCAVFLDSLLLLSSLGCVPVEFLEAFVLFGHRISL